MNIQTLNCVALGLVIIFCGALIEAKRIPRVEAPPPHIHGRFIYVSWSADKGYEVKTFGLGYSDADPVDYDWVAKARYQNFMNKTGWTFVEVESKTTYPDEIQAHAAGLAEGYLTRDLIWYFYKNVVEHYCDDKPVLCKYVKKYLQQNLDWTMQSAKKYKSSSEYWYQTNLVLEQGEGIAHGFRMAANRTSMKISDTEFALFNILGDLDDLETALDPNPKNARRRLLQRDGHCSALIKLIGKHDIYFSHNTWTQLQMMLRVIKRYNLAFKRSASANAETVPTESISMSSYPGMVYSMDDFYTLSSGLAVMETTIINYNHDLWKNVSTTNSIFTSVRTMVANRLANDGEEWTKIFSKYNSGTYNNQWMVLNYNLFEPMKPINDGLLWVLEQLPGMVTSRDVTDVLKSQGYWASYNNPYFKEIYEASGTPKMVEKYGDFFSYTETPRAKIFKRDQSSVEDVEDMMKLMRYNDYQHDEFSKCKCDPPYSAVSAISSRGDLNPANGTFPFPTLGHRTSAAIDMKLTTLDLFLLQQFIAIGGPTYDPLPPFEFSKSDLKDKPHHGIPDKLEFEPLIHHWKWL